VKLHVPQGLSSISERRGKGYRFMMVAELRARQSTPSRKPLSIFFSNEIGAAAGDDEQWKKPCARLVAMYALSVLSSTSERLQIRPYGILQPGSRSIAWSMDWCGSSVTVMVLLKTSTKSE